MKKIYLLLMSFAIAFAAPFANAALAETITSYEFKDVYEFTKVTSNDDLQAGDQVIFFYESKQQVLGAISSTYRAARQIFDGYILDTDEGTLVLYDDYISKTSSDKYAYLLTVGGEEGAWTFYDDVNSGYLYTPQGSGKLSTGEPTDRAAAQATLTFDESGAVDFVFNDTSGSYTSLRRYSSRFGCYASTVSSSTYNYFQIYKVSKYTEDYPWLVETEVEAEEEAVDAEKSFTYTKVTSTDDLADGDQIIFVYEGTPVAMSLQQNKYRDLVSVDVTSTTTSTTTTDDEGNTTTTETTTKSISLKESEIATSSTDALVFEFTLGRTDSTDDDGNTTSTYTFYDPVTGGYLYNSAKNSVYTTTSSNYSNQADNTMATIDITDGDASIYFSGYGYYLQYNKNSGTERFACYNNTQQAIQIYKKSITGTYVCDVYIDFNMSEDNTNDIDAETEPTDQADVSLEDGSTDGTVKFAIYDLSLGAYGSLGDVVLNDIPLVYEGDGKYTFGSHDAQTVELSLSGIAIAASVSIDTSSSYVTSDGIFFVDVNVIWDSMLGEAMDTSYPIYVRVTNIANATSYVGSYTTDLYLGMGAEIGETDDPVDETTLTISYYTEETTQISTDEDGNETSTTTEEAVLGYANLSIAELSLESLGFTFSDVTLSKLPLKFTSTGKLLFADNDPQTLALTSTSGVQLSVTAYVDAETSYVDGEGNALINVCVDVSGTTIYVRLTNLVNAAVLAAQTYTGDLYLALSAPVDDDTESAGEYTVEVTKSEYNTVSLTIPNLTLYSMTLGDITLSDLSLEESEEEGIYTFGEHNPQTLTLSMMGTEVTATACITTSTSYLATDGGIYLDIELVIFNEDGTSYPGRVRVSNIDFIDASADVETEATEAGHIRFTRDFSAGWNTLCLPFAITAEALGASDVQVLTSATDEAITFSATEDGVTANVPCLVYFESATSISEKYISAALAASSEVSTQTEGDVSLIGNYTAAFSMSGLYGLATIDDVQKIVLGAEGSTLKATGAYFTLPEGSSSELAVKFNGETTGISHAVSQEKAAVEGIYTLSGVKLQTSSLKNLPAGVYIVNGKKVILK